MQFVKYSKNFAVDIFRHVKTDFGRIVREAGLDLDRRGCAKMNDISCF